MYAWYKHTPVSIINCFCYTVVEQVLFSFTVWMKVSLDDRTAQKTLWLSEGGTKVSRMSDEVCPVLDRPERYEHSPQVHKCVSELVSFL